MTARARALRWSALAGALLGLLLLAGCGGNTSVKDALPEATIAKLTPAQERYILLADIKTWTGVARAYASKEFCSPVLVVNCADKQVVVVLGETLARLGPTVEVLRLTASADELTTYLSIGTTLLLQLQAELAQALAEEAI